MDVSAYLAYFQERQNRWGCAAGQQHATGHHRAGLEHQAEVNRLAWVELSADRATQTRDRIARHYREGARWHVHEGKPARVIREGRARHGLASVKRTVVVAWRTHDEAPTRRFTVEHHGHVHGQFTGLTFHRPAHLADADHHHGDDFRFALEE